MYLKGRSTCTEDTALKLCKLDVFLRVLSESDHLSTKGVAVRVEQLN